MEIERVNADEPEAMSFINNLLKKFALGLVVSLLATSCSRIPVQHSEEAEAVSTFWLGVDSLMGEPEPNKSFVIASGNPEVDANDLKFLEFKGQLTIVLRKAGYAEARTPKEASSVVLLSYKVVEQTEGVTSLEQAHSLESYGKWSGSRIETVRAEALVRKSFQRTIQLTAVRGEDYVKGVTSPRRNWEVSVASVGSTSDWRFLFPRMIAGAASYIGTGMDSGIRKLVLVRKDSKFEGLLAEIQAPVQGGRLPTGN